MRIRARSEKGMKTPMWESSAIIVALLGNMADVGESAFTTADISEPIYWDISNKNFFKSPGNAPEIQVSLGGTLNVLCPYSDGPKYQHKLPIFDIFMVDRRSYEKCRLPDSDGTNRRFKKLIYSCDQPFERKKLTLQVLQVSPIFDAPVFNPDQAYYFVTSEQKLCERGLKLTAHVTQGTRDVPRLEEEVAPTVEYDTLDEEIRWYDENKILVFCVLTILLLSLLGLTVYMALRARLRRQRRTRKQNRSHDIDQAGYASNSTSSTHNPSLHRSPSDQAHMMGLSSPTKSSLPVYRSSGPGIISKSISVNGLQHNTKCSAFKPYRSSVGSSMTILQTSAPWVIDLNTGENLLASDNSAASRVHLATQARHPEVMYNPVKLVQTLPNHEYREDPGLFQNADGIEYDNHGGGQQNGLIKNLAAEMEQQPFFRRQRSDTENIHTFSKHSHRHQTSSSSNDSGSYAHCPQYESHGKLLADDPHGTQPASRTGQSANATASDFVVEI